MMLANAVGARADARVWAAMRRVEQAKQAAAEKKRREAAQRILNAGKQAAGDDRKRKLLAEEAGNKRDGDM